MGLFGIDLPNPFDAVKHAVGWVGDRANDAAHFVADHADDLKYLNPAYDIEQGAGWLAEKVKQHWKTLVTIAVGALVFTAVVTAIVLSGGTATALLTVVVAGALSGAASQTTQDLLNGDTPGWDVLKSAAVSAAFAGVSWGALRLAQPVIAPIAERFPIVARLGFVQGVKADVTAAATSGESAAENAVSSGTSAVEHDAGGLLGTVEREAVQFRDAVTQALSRYRPSPIQIVNLFANDPERPKVLRPKNLPTPRTPGFVRRFEDGIDNAYPAPAGGPTPTTAVSVPTSAPTTGRLTNRPLGE